MENEEKKEYENRLQRRLQVLKKQLDEGKIFVKKGLKVAESLESVEFLLDGTADLSTVDSAVRAMALGVEFHHDREEMKQQLSLHEIQSMYFETLEKNFGEFYDVMIAKGLSPYDVAISLSRKDSTVKELERIVHPFVEFIKSFWSTVTEVVYAHVEDIQGLKGVYGGDLFPSYGENLASKCGLYLDTIILPDPFLRSIELFKVWSPTQRVYYLVKHALNLLSYKQLACAEFKTPLVVVLPDKTALAAEEKEYFLDLAQTDSLVHAAAVFGRPFNEFDDLMEFAGSLDTIEKAVSAVKDKERILFDTDWPGTPQEQLRRALESENYNLYNIKIPGVMLVSQGLGRMGTSNELLFKARGIRGTPIIDIPTSWRYFVWKLEYDAARSRTKEGDLKPLHAIRGLQNAADGEMEWIGRIPSDALIELRKTGAIDEIREIIGRGMNELTLVDPDDFGATSEQVVLNIREAFEEHKIKIKQLSDKEWTFAKSQIGSWLVTGTAAVAAAATGHAFWGLAALAADQILDAPKLAKLPRGIRELVEDEKTLRRSPVGMLFKYSKK